jgi:hypothetical protein
MTEETRLPGCAREMETVINGKLIARILCVDAKHSMSCAKLWATGHYDQLCIAELENPGLQSIDFLSCFEHVTSVHILLDRKVSLAPLIQHADTLAKFFCNDGLNGLVDCRPFLSLESLGQKWQQGMKFASVYPRLVRLSFSGSLSKSRDLSVLPCAGNLEVLGLFQTSIENLHGIERYPELKEIFICQARKLHDISQIAELEHLKRVEFENCHHLAQGGMDWRQCRNLQKMLYMKCTALSDLQFIRSMPELRSLVIMDTNVLDGNMNPVLEHPRLEHFACTSYRHFTHKEAQLMKILRKRKSENFPGTQ